MLIFSNSKIFELQTAALRYELGDDHVYDFVEGSIPCDPAPGVTSISSTNDEYFAYFDETSSASCREVLGDLDAYVRSAGPFDAVMAFSMGASLAATLMARNARQRLAPPFRCAVFLCGGVPGEPLALAQDESYRAVDFPTTAADSVEVIAVPTAHIWGKNDPRNPAYGPILSRFCRSQLRCIFVHEGGHEIPGTKDRAALMKAVACIRGTIDRALTIY